MSSSGALGRSRRVRVHRCIRGDSWLGARQRPLAAEPCSPGLRQLQVPSLPFHGQGKPAGARLPTRVTQILRRGAPAAPTAVSTRARPRSVSPARDLGAPGASHVCRRRSAERGGTSLLSSSSPRSTRNRPRVRRPCRGDTIRSKRVPFRDPTAVELPRLVREEALARPTLVPSQRTPPRQHVEDHEDTHDPPPSLADDVEVAAPRGQAALQLRVA